MFVRFTALAVVVVACAAVFSAHAADPVPRPLTLPDAFARVVNSHPQLRLFGARRDGLTAALDSASQTPALVAGAEIENALGSGAARGMGGAEFTLSLASVLERGGKRDARRALARSRIDALGAEREAQRLDLLAEVARRYLAVVATRGQQAIAQRDITQRKRAVVAAQRRHQAGAAPESVVLTAQAALARTELDLARAEQRLVAARQHLAALWGERAPSFVVVDVNLLALPKMASFATLDDWLRRAPELTRFADQQRIREARLQLARSQASPDVSWQVGVRRLPGRGDVGLVAGISIPLGAATRAEPEMRAARAELVALDIEREAEGLSLYSTLAEAHGRYRVARIEVRRLGKEIIPRLIRAEAAAAKAYKAGAASYLAWSTLQAERTAARKQQLEAALAARRALIEIQRLTGQAFVFADAAAPTQSGVTP